MKLSLEQGPESKEVKFEKGDRIIEVLTGQEISPDITIVFLGDKPIPLDSLAKEGMVLRVVSVASGG